MMDYLDMQEVNYIEPPEHLLILKEQPKRQTQNANKPHTQNFELMGQSYSVSLSNSLYMNPDSYFQQDHIVQIINPFNNSTQPTQNFEKFKTIASLQRAEQSSQRARKQKNNNTIKKLGRIILDHIKKYTIYSKTNAGVTNMMKVLGRDSKVGRSEVNKRDKFNTYHLDLLLNKSDRLTNSINKRITRRVLCCFLRRNVKESQQISQQSKLVYLNTLKCSALRCCNGRLAVRLQMAS